MPEENMKISATSRGFRSRQLSTCCKVQDITRTLSSSMREYILKASDDGV
jgi:hypothetical protein